MSPYVDEVPPLATLRDRLGTLAAAPLNLTRTKSANDHKVVGRMPLKQHAPCHSIVLLHEALWQAACVNLTQTSPAEVRPRSWLASIPRASHRGFPPALLCEIRPGRLNLYGYRFVDSVCASVKIDVLNSATPSRRPHLYFRGLLKLHTC